MHNRVDLTLKHLCLAKSRSMAKTLCDAGRVIINGAAARASGKVSPGDRVTIQFHGRTVTVEVADVPEKQLSKAAAPAYYRAIETPPEEVRVDPLEDL